MPKDPELIVYWYPGMCVRVTLIALEEIGKPFDAVLVPRADKEAMAAYMSDVNPKGKIPALSVDGRVITETPAIMTYLDRRFPEANLLPKDPDDSLDALILMSWFAAGVHPNIAKARFLMAHTSDKACWDSVRGVALENLRDCLSQIEERFSDGRQWLFGEWSVVDAYLLWIWFRAVGAGFTEKDFPLVDASVRRCQERPSATRTLNREAETHSELEAAGKTVKFAPPLTAGWLPALC